MVLIGSHRVAASDDQGERWEDDATVYLHNASQQIIFSPYVVLAPKPSKKHGSSSVLLTVHGTDKVKDPDGWRLYPGESVTLKKPLPARGSHYVTGLVFDDALNRKWVRYIDMNNRLYRYPPRWWQKPRINRWIKRRDTKKFYGEG